MNLTVSDLQRMYSRHMTLVAGRGGLSRAITSVGILDYELLPDMRDTYLRPNAGSPGSLMVSTFLYARENPHLIVDAVRSLCATGASGLVIKNVFHLRIPDAAIRLAEARDFPIFVLASDDLFVDTIIIEVNRRIERLRAETDLLAALDRIARESRPSEAVREQAHDLLPSLMERCIVLFANTHDAIDADAFESVEKAWKASGLSRPGSLMAQWRDGIVIVCTQQPSLPLEAEDVIEVFQHDIAPSLDTRDKGLTTTIGTSSRHDQLSELGCALCEAYEASCIAWSRGRDEMGYDELGILGAILPNLRGDFEGDPPLVEWANGLLGPMRDRDDETGGKLSETLVAYFENRESIPSTAATLGQHENTVRYRLTRIGDLTGADWREAEGREQLSLACHILECRDALRGMRPSRRPVPSPLRSTLSE